MEKIALHWLHQPKSGISPASFGTPWKRGVLMPEDSLVLENGKGGGIPLQTKVSAYWPDGSVKWLHHSAVLERGGEYCIKRNQTPTPPMDNPLAFQKSDGSVRIESEELVCSLGEGENLISSLKLKKDGFQPLSAELFSLVEHREDGDDCENITVHRLRGFSERVTLEESGPVRAVVKVEGNHRFQDGRGTLFPFTVRLYFHRGTEEIKIVHTFVYDGDENQDFLKGIAVRFNLVAGGELWNRHVSFAGDTGLFYEAVQPAYTNDIKTVHPLYEKQQTEGRFISLDGEENEELRKIVSDNSAWGDFRLSQDSCDHYVIEKRTKPGCAPITAVQGSRSMGSMFFGNEQIMLAAGVKDFWRKSPMALEVNGAAGSRPSMTVWLWSRYAGACDFRAYDRVTHQYSYGEILNHPQGIANTNEIILRLFDQMPGKDGLMDFAEDVSHDLLLVTEPQLYGETEVFGNYWLSPMERGAGDEASEKALKHFSGYYIDEVERRRWYGFWDYGDVMHSYDPVRHSWRYDVGGFAWQNTELCNTYLHWITFLRTGDYSIFRLARAMARHTSEVDVYHSGKYAMLGSRHNVRHWGCRWKEPRISMAGHHRFFYYLTGDERIGDIMDFVRGVDSQMALLHEGEVTERGAPVRTGPDWSSFVSNWMTHWERTGKRESLDKILAGLESIGKAPLGLSSGSTFLYDEKTGKMHYYGDGNYQYHMVICFGAPEIWLELADLLDGEDSEKLKDMMARFGEFYAMTPEEREEASGGLFNADNEVSWRGRKYAIRMIAYAGYRLGRQELMDMAVDLIREEPDTGTSTPGRFGERGELIYHDVPLHESPYPLKEWEKANTNGTAQWSLNYMETTRLRELMKNSEKKL